LLHPKAQGIGKTGAEAGARYRQIGPCGGKARRRVECRDVGAGPVVGTAIGGAVELEVLVGADEKAAAGGQVCTRDRYGDGQRGRGLCGGL
jgi:hypothetical protein